MARFLYCAKKSRVVTIQVSRATNDSMSNIRHFFTFHMLSAHKMSKNIKMKRKKK